MSTLISSYQLFSLYKGETCFQTSSGRSIDLMLTNKMHSFMKSQSFETDFNNHHHMIYIILEATCINLPPKITRYREYRNIQREESQGDLHTKLNEVTHADYQALHSAIEDIVQDWIVRWNNCPI